MKRFHVHLAVENLAENIHYYSSLFGVKPDVVQNDYAKWMLDDPRINFAISRRGAKPGLDHMGIQVDSDEELGEINTRLQAAEQPSIQQQDAACCYARSNKYWSVDPQGIAWEGFHSLGSIPTFNEGNQVNEESGSTCCAPEMKSDSNCCA